MFRKKQATEQLLIAVKLKKVPEITRLVKCGVDANSPIDKTGKTCLHYAVCDGEVSTVKALIEAGADLNIRDEDGHTPLHRAMVDGNTTVMKILVDAGSSLDAVDENGNTALHEAAWNGYSHCTNILLSADSNVNLHNKTGYSPLHLAAQNGHMTTVQMLLKNGSYPMSKNNYGDTPLHIAVRYGHEEMTKVLIDAGVNVSDQNNEGNTPLHVAAQSGQSRIVNILLDGGSTIAVRNNVGDTARDIAIQNCFKDIVKMIPCTGTGKGKQKSEKVIPRHLLTDTTSTFATTNTLLYVPRPEPGNPVPKKPWQRKEYLKFLSWRSKKEEESNMIKAKADVPPLKFEEMCSIEKEFSARSIIRRSHKSSKRSKEIQEKRKSSGFYSEPALELKGESQQEQTSTAESKEQVSEDIRVSKSKTKEKGFFNIFRSASDTELRTEPKQKGLFFGRKLWDKSSISTKESEDQRGSYRSWMEEDDKLEEGCEKRMRESQRRRKKQEREWTEYGDKMSEGKDEKTKERRERKHRGHKHKSHLESDRNIALRGDSSSPCHSPRLRHRSPLGEGGYDHIADRVLRHKSRDSEGDKRHDEHKKGHRGKSGTETRSKSRERASRKHHESGHAQLENSERKSRSKSNERRSKKHSDSEHAQFENGESKSRSKSAGRKSRKHSDSEHAVLDMGESKSRSKSTGRKSRKHSDSEHALLETIEGKPRSKSTGRRSRKHSDSEHAHIERYENNQRSRNRERRHSEAECIPLDSEERDKSLRRSTSRKHKEKLREDGHIKNSAHARRKTKDSQTQTGVDTEAPMATLLQVGTVPCHVVSARCETCSSSMRTFEARQEQCASDIDTTRRTLEHRLKRLEEKFDKQFSSTEKLRREQETREKYEYERIVCRVTDECREVNKHLKQEADEIRSDVRTLISDRMGNLEGKMDRMATSSLKRDKVSHAYMYMGGNTFPHEKLTRSSPVLGLTGWNEKNVTTEDTVPNSPTSVKSMPTHNNFSTVRVSRSQALDTLQDPTVRDHSLVESPGSSDIDRRNGRDDNETRDVVKCSEAIAKSKDRGTVCERINELETRIRTETNSDDYRL